MMPSQPPDLAAVLSAARRLAGRAHRTPVATCATLDRLAGRSLFFKCEHLQKAGAFKFRGACNAVWRLANDAAPRGVVTHSSGNHAQALALAARMRGIPAHVVIPSNASPVKRRAQRPIRVPVAPREPPLQRIQPATVKVRLSAPGLSLSTVRRLSVPTSPRGQAGQSEK